MQIEVILPGVLTTLQDQGRVGYRRDGVPVAGCMDPVAATIANLLVGNHRDSTVMELTYGGSAFRASTDLLIACTGGGAALQIDDRDIPFWRPVFVPAGSRLSFTTTPSQTRTYLAIAGGWDCPTVLGSRSTYLPAAFGGIEGRRLRKGDLLTNCFRISAASQALLMQLTNESKPIYPRWQVNPFEFARYGSNEIRFVKGHEYDWFDGPSLRHFEESTFTVSRQSGRMGYVLEGPPLQRVVAKELYSTAVVAGTIQVTASGTAMVLMADGQTTGGYPRIGQVAAVDIPVLAQFHPGNTFRFVPIGMEEAEARYLTQQEGLDQLENVLIARFRQA